jgi:outer membrane protein
MRSTHWLCALTLALPALGAAGEADPGRELTLEDCVRLALAGDSSVAVARKQADISALGVAQAGAAFRPQVRVNGGFTYNSPSRQAPDQPSHVALNGIREYLALATATQEVDTSGRLRAARDRARAERSAAGGVLQVTLRDLKRQVIGSYYRLILARHLATLARDALAESRSFEARTKLLFEKGEAARADVVKAAAQSAVLEQSVASSDLDADIASHELLSFWTSDLATPARVVDVLAEPLPEPPTLPEAAPDAPFMARPELAVFTAQRDGLLADARRARGDRLPQVSLGFQYGIDSLRLSAADRGWAAFASVDVPVFDWFKSRDAARQFDLAAEQTDANRRIAERTFSREYADAVSRVRLIHSQIETARSAVRLSEENLHLSRVRYDGGEGPALDVVTAQTQVKDARANLDTLATRYLESLADLDVASGR